MRQDLASRWPLPSATAVILAAVAGTGLTGCQAPSSPEGVPTDPPVASATPTAPVASATPVLPVPSRPGIRPSPTIEVPPPIR